MGGPRTLLDQPSAHNVGRSVRVEPRGQVALLDLNGDDAAARSLAVVITIRPLLEVGSIDAAAITRGDDVLAARVLVELGSGGHRIAVELDVLRGLAFTLHASALRVTAINDGPAAEIGAFATYAETRAGVPQLTRFGPELAMGASWLVEVPPFAQAFEVVALDTALRVDVGRGRAGERWLYAQELTANTRMTHPLPIANGCGRVRVTNRGPSSAIPIAIFDLAL